MAPQSVLRLQIRIRQHSIQQQSGALPALGPDSLYDKSDSASSCVARLLLSCSLWNWALTLSRTWSTQTRCCFPLLPLLPETARAKSILQAPGVQAHNCFTHQSADMSTCTVSMRWWPLSVDWSFLFLWPRVTSASFLWNGFREGEVTPRLCLSEGLPLYPECDSM